MGVVIFHAFPGLLRGGFVGVDIFFVISGYLITTIINNSIKDRSFSVIEFYSRRINRIFPALILMLVTVMLFSWFVLLPSDLEALGKHVAGGMGFSQNLVLYKEAGYFDASAISKPLLHLWSLGVEEQFYLTLPILALAFSSKPSYFPFAIVIIALASFGISLHNSYANPEAAFYLPASRAWELLIGGLIATFYVRTTLSTNLCNAFSIVGALLICASMIIIEEGMRFPGWAALAPTMGAALIISAGPTAIVNRLVLRSRPFVLIGLISFPLYLWHWPLLSIAWLVDAPGRLERLALVAIAIILSIATYRLVELPAKRCRHKGRLSIALLIVGIALLGAGITIYKAGGFPDRESIKKYSEIDKSLAWIYSKNELCKETFGKPDYLDEWTFCYTNSKTPDVIIIGNSFANHLYPGLANNTDMAGKGVLSIGICDPAAHTDWGNPENPKSPCASRKADLERTFIDEIIKNTASIKTVIINAWWPAFDASGNYVNAGGNYGEKKVKLFDRPEMDDNSSFENYFYGLEDRVSFLERAGKAVVIFGPKPELRKDIKSCIGRPLGKTEAGCSSDTSTELNKVLKFREGVYALMVKHPNLKYFDQFDLFCDSHVCIYFRDGKPLLRDDAHLSVYGSSYVMDSFVAWSKEHMPELLK
ncbi:peptidoglycan/LPS O-acetylase OafA/YrhL [Pseudomonas sp. GV047]|nr:peptidoglycan/LPS O-acetylase OafA/YrhL [Pseudomonas sp. GV047]